MTIGIVTNLQKFGGLFGSLAQLDQCPMITGVKAKTPTSPVSSAAHHPEDVRQGRVGYSDDSGESECCSTSYASPDSPVSG